MSTEIVAAKSPQIDIEAIQSLVLHGDLSNLSPTQKVQYYSRVCEIVGLNPTTKPFDYLKLNGKDVLYANKGCAEQLRMVHKISLKITAREKIDDVYVVTAEAQGGDGRVDSATGAVPIANLKGDALANAMMKAETKAKRRVTLSICGLNMLDETEVETIQTYAANVRPQQPEEGDGFEPFDDGTYKVDFGQWKGKTLEWLAKERTVGPARISAYIAYLEEPKQIASRRPELVEPVRLFIAEAEKFLASLENGDSKE